MPKIQLSLYLLRPEETPATAVRSDGEPTDIADALPLKDGDGGPWIQGWLLDPEQEEPGVLPDSREGAPALLVRGTPARTPWLSLIGAIAPAAAVNAQQQNLGALLFQPVDGEVVVWSFGNAWNLLDPERTVNRFGLRAGLNALLSTPAPADSTTQVGVRLLTSAIRAFTVRRSTLATTRPSSPSAMERVDQATDAASMAELTTHHTVFDRISAGRSLRFQADVNTLADLDGLAREALRLYRRDDYTTHPDYEWIDYTVPVQDPDEIDAVLDAVYAEATRATNPLTVDMVWADADPETGLTPTFVCFPYERATPTSSRRLDLQWSSVAPILASRSPAGVGRDVLKVKVRFYQDDLSLTETLEVWQLLVAQVDVGGQTYMVSDGEILRASATHIANIDALLRPHVIVNPPYLPRYRRNEKEGDYNVRASSHGDHFLLDKNLVRLDGQTAFEPCDLLTGDGQLLHVKRKTRSSTMSHVVSQAQASTQMLRNVDEARNKLDLALSNAAPSPARLGEMRDHCISFASVPTGSVEVVIVGTWRGTPDISQLPLLTRISLSNWRSQMPCPSRVVLVGE